MDCLSGQVRHKEAITRPLIRRTLELFNSLNFYEDADKERRPRGTYRYSRKVKISRTRRRGTRTTGGSESHEKYQKK